MNALIIAAIHNVVHMHLLIRGTEAILIGFDLFNNVALNTCIDKTGSSIWCNGEQISNISPVKMVVVSILTKKKDDSVQGTLAKPIPSIFQEYIPKITQLPVLVNGSIAARELSFLGSGLSFLV